MENSQLAYQQKLKDYFNDVYKKADKKMEYFIWGFFVFGLLLASFYDTWTIAIGVGSACLGIYYLCLYTLPGTFFLRVVISLIFWNFVAQYIIQMHGMYEMHFMYFVGLTILILYQDWRVTIPLTVYATIHHTIFFVLQLQGVQTQDFFINIDDVTYITFLIHMGIAATHSVLCSFWADLLRRQSENDALKSFQLETQLQNMEININFATNISNGQLDISYPHDQPDDLGKSLIHMKDSIDKAAQREKQEKYINIGIAKSVEILRNNNHDSHTFSDNILSFLINYIHANQGYLFILNEDEETPCLELMSCYAYDRKKYIQKKVAIGEGLVGQCYLEKQYIQLSELPQNYVSITSGVGEAVPGHLLIIPLIINEKVYGILEIASFQQFKDYEIEFIEKVGESIASSVSSIKVNQITQRLLKDSQLQTEQMRAQEEEMRQNQEELQTTQEELARQKKELEEEIQFLKQQLAQEKST